MSLRPKVQLLNVFTLFIVILMFSCTHFNQDIDEQIHYATNILPTMSYLKMKLTESDKMGHLNSAENFILILGYTINKSMQTYLSALIFLYISIRLGIACPPATLLEVTIV